jgi:uncharacterized protein with GYD domain
MKYVLLGTLAADWATKHDKRLEQAKAKLRDLNITLQSVNYTQGPYDFVDVVEAPNPEAMLAFSVWYAAQGFGRIQSLPAFDAETLSRVARKS